MREFFHNMKLSFLLAAVLYIILGLILLIWPGVSATVFCYAFGGILLIYGVVTIVSFFLRDSRQGSFVFELFLGIVAAALGLLFLLRPVIVASVLPVILGLFIVVDGLVNLKRALELRRMLYLRWTVPLVLSAVSAVLGLVIVFQPFLAAEALVMLIGAVLIYEGLSDLWTIFRVSQWTKSTASTIRWMSTRSILNKPIKSNSRANARELLFILTFHFNVYIIIDTKTKCLLCGGCHGRTGIIMVVLPAGVGTGYRPAGWTVPLPPLRGRLPPGGGLSPRGPLL